MDDSGNESASSGNILQRLDDPFAPREGKNLTWRNVNMKLKGKKKNEMTRTLLDDVWGEVPKKEITAIMGPSGSGKTSLLNILAGRTVSKGNLKVEADVRLDNVTCDPSSIDVRKQIAFVAQDDSLQITATPRECIKFSAKLRLPRSITNEQLDTLTNKMIEELGLTSCADTYVGGPLLKGISGGERKRTSVGVELVTKPALVFLDEPTSGLDSYSATQLVDLLHKIADAGSSVLFTIHQPSSEVFNGFDRVVLLKEGRVMYQGSTGDVSSYFADRSHPMPDNFNPSDWIMTIAQQNTTDELEGFGYFPKDEREDRASIVKGKSLRLSVLDSEESGFDGRKVSFGTQLSMLFKRELLNMKRDTTALVARIGLTIFLNVLFGLIFLRAADKDKTDMSNVQSTLGCYILVVLNTMFGSAQPALFAIPAERPVFLREYSTNHYSAGAYFISKMSVEAVTTFLQIMLMAVISYFLMGFQANFAIFFLNLFTLGMASTAVSVLLGCAIEDPKMAQELLPLLFVPQMLFSGFFVAISFLPSWLRWIQWVCSLTYGLRIGTIVELKSCLDDDNEVAVANCERLLSQLNANRDDQWWYWIVLISLFVALRTSAFFVLKAKAAAFY